MSYIKPHLSPELRAQITPHQRRDVKLTVAAVVFSLLSILLVINLWPTKSPALSNNKTESPAAQSQPSVLGDSTTQAAQQTPEFTQYTVKAGDTLFNISQQYDVKWDLIAQVNNLSEPYVLHAGDLLKIPQATTSQIPDKVYTVKDADTLASIAQQFNITTNDIIAVNPNLQNSDLITPGQIIKLP